MPRRSASVREILVHSVAAAKQRDLPLAKSSAAPAAAAAAVVVAAAAVEGAKVPAKEAAAVGAAAAAAYNLQSLSVFVVVWLTD